MGKLYNSESKGKGKCKNETDTVTHKEELLWKNAILGDRSLNHTVFYKQVSILEQEVSKTTIR